LDEINDEQRLFVYPVGEGVCALEWGADHPAAGAEALASLKAASAAALGSQIHGIVTAPVNKHAIGGGFTGQTDFLAGEAGEKSYAMAFFAPTFTVVLATVHMPLRQALERISTDLYVNLIRLVDNEMKRFSFERRRIAVAGINPHA